MSEAEDILVVKYGSGTVTNGQGMDAGLVEGYVAELASLRAGYQIVVVSSGSIVVGKALWESAHGSEAPAPSDQTLATIGSGQAFNVWQRAFRAHGVLAGQILVTHHEMDDQLERPMLKRVMEDSMQAGVINVVNENDALSDEEVATYKYGGDNDGLASYVARLLGARQLCLMTDIDGLLDENRSVIREVQSGDEAEAIRLARYAVTDAHISNGGMITKVEAALRATRGGIEAHIAHAEAAPTDVIAGRAGTRFIAQ